MYVSYLHLIDDTFNVCLISISMRLISISIDDIFNVFFRYKSRNSTQMEQLLRPI